MDASQFDRIEHTTLFRFFREAELACQTAENSDRQCQNVMTNSRGNRQRALIGRRLKRIQIRCVVIDAAARRQDPRMNP